MVNRLSLLDVLPRHERVDIGSGIPIDVYGISGYDLGMIMDRYPNAFEILIEFAKHPVRGMDPGLTGAFLAACQRTNDEESFLGNETVERRCRTLGLHPQFKMLLAMGRCTFPDGIGPFLRDYELISSATSEAVTVIVQAATKAEAMASQQTPKHSEQPATPASGN
jgi:hypothetical protein